MYKIYLHIWQSYNVRIIVCNKLYQLIRFPHYSRHMTDDMFNKYSLQLLRIFPVKFCLFFPRRQAAVGSFQSNLFYIYDTTLLGWHRVWSRNFHEWNLQSLFFSIFHIRQCLVSCAILHNFCIKGTFKMIVILRWVIWGIVIQYK